MSWAAEVLEERRWDAYVASGEFGLDEIEADIKSMEQGYFVFRRWDKDG